jgi:hypothetical protein
MKILHNLTPRPPTLDRGPERNVPDIRQDILLLLLLLLTKIELSLGGSSPYTSSDKTSKNRYA